MNLYNDLSKVLTDYQGYFAPTIKDYVIFSRINVYKTDFELYFGLAIFIKKGLKVKSTGDFFVYGKKFILDTNDLNSLPKNAQYLSFIKEGKIFTICNIHGIWRKDGKHASPSNLNQSSKLLKFLNKHKRQKIFFRTF